MLVVNTTAGEDRAVRTACTPPGRDATIRASPPPAGSTHRAGVSPSPSSSAASALRREDVKSRSPSGVKDAPVSPWALRVRRREGFARLGYPSHSAVWVLVPSWLSVATCVTSRDPSGESTRPEMRGRRTYSSRSVSYTHLRAHETDS